ncbi:GGDEF domain-containing protein [Anaerovorax odorimutans]|uniref:GGDEF domain-containing protein n=1 Tax=Anaerovorax odorimutans TaxID=109327 RepID=A0ABT1RN94_9FIRM|nr:GGDEF domain-containing protein [Anaerovorax odorimutans]MCQ4636644.1 GGDEF domain-containing protein [Anaerovorax odorimutans]
MFSVLLVLVVGVAYFYFNWQFMAFVDDCFGRERKAGQIVCTFVINYAVFYICSSLQLHLIANWTIFFIFLVVEVFIIYRSTWVVSAYMALLGVVQGLAINIILRCGFSLILVKPLTLFDNQVTEGGNLKRYPVLLGFLLAGMLFQLARRKGVYTRVKRLAEDRASLSFLVRIVLILYVYLVLNLLTYYTGGNELVMKLWGIKSALFAMLGLYFASSYSMRMSRLKTYADANKREREALFLEKQEEEQLRTLAYTDLLTGCGNRQYADAVLAEEWQNETAFSICFVDLNGLKEINDRYGHLDGDQYLLTVARTIKQYIRMEDLLFRYGGDEFLILFLDTKGEVPLQRMKSVNQELAGFCKERGSKITMSVSWGLADRKEAESVQEMLGLADERMYRNKQETHRQRR